MLNIEFLQETHQMLQWWGRSWYRLYQTQERQVTMLEQRTTCITIFGKSGWQIWRCMGGWFNIRKRLQNNHRFACHHHLMIEENWEDLWQINSPCDIFTNFLITFSWIWMKSTSIATSVFLGAKINLATRKWNESMISIKILWVGSTSGVNSPVIFIAKG